MNKWIAEFDLEDGDTMPECMDLEYKGAKLDFHCRPMWIPVSERLPEESIKQIMLGDEHTSDFVLVTIKGQTYPFPKAKVKVARYSYTHKAWQIANNNFGKVVAWMPLPEPYKTESEE